MYVAVGVYTTLIYSYDGETWYDSPNAYKTGTHFYKVVYANGIFIAVGGSLQSAIARSTDGINWTYHVLPITGRSINTVATDGTNFVVILQITSGTTGNDSIFKSTDGINWTTHNSPIYRWSASGLEYGNGTWLAVGARMDNDGNYDCIYSYDGAYWQTSPHLQSQFSTLSYFKQLSFSNGMFMAIVSPNTASSLTAWNTTGTGGATWSQNNFYFPVTGTAFIGYVNDVWLILTSSTTYDIQISSDNGYTWVKQAYGYPARQWSGICYGNNKLVAVGYANPDSIVLTANVTPAIEIGTFVSHTTGDTTVSYLDMVYGGDKFVAIGQGDSPNYMRIKYSYNGISWLDAVSPDPTAYGPNKITYGNNTFVITSGNGGQIYYSSDGITWNIGTNPWGSSNIYDLSFANGYFFIGRFTYSYNNFARSTDGINWTIYNQAVYGFVPVKTAHNGAGLYVSVGNTVGTSQGRSQYSYNGTTWYDSGTVLNGFNFSDVIFQDGYFIACIYGYAAYNHIFRSTDGITWTETPMGLPFGSTGTLNLINDPVNKIIYAIFYNTNRNNVLCSRNNGLSWFTIPVDQVDELWGCIALNSTKVVIMAYSVSNGTTNIRRSAIATIGSATTRPDDFVWIEAPISDGLYPLALDIENLKTSINAFRVYKNLVEYSFLYTIIAGNLIMAADINDLKTALTDLSGDFVGFTLQSPRIIGDDITALDWSNLSDCLNSII
jgi:hypothetical protein